MTRSHQYATGAVFAGLAAAVMLLGAGCGEGVQSRASSGEPQAPKSVAVAENTEPALAERGNDATAAKDETADEADKQDAAAAETSRNEQMDVDGEPAVTRSPAAGRKSTREITFDTLKFEIEKGQAFERSMLTAGIEKLAGERVRIRGYMLPSFQQSGIKQFVLVRDNMECCFGPGAALYDCLIVEMVDDQSCEFSVRPIAVEGTFTIREFKGPDDTHLAIFHLDGERVR
jgi:hypothetical protein